MHAVVIAVLVLQLLESSECNTVSDVSCTCPANPNFEVRCTNNAWTLQIKDDRTCGVNECFHNRLCCRYSADSSGVIQSEIRAGGKCTLLEDPQCTLKLPPITCGYDAPANCFVMCKPVIDYEDTTVSSSTPITADNTTLATAPDTSPQTAPDTSPPTAPATSPPTAPATSPPTATTSSQHTPKTTSSHHEHTDSTGNTQEIQDAEDDAFPVATAVTVPIAIVAVAAIIVAAILRCRCKQTSKGDPDINNRPMHNGVIDNALVNPSYNENDIGVNRTQASTPAVNVAPDDTVYAECGPIDESLKPIDQRVRQKLGNKPGKTPLNGDPYDHLRQDGRSITRDPNYAHLEMEFIDKEYSHIISIGESNDGNMDNGRIADINTYNHLETNPGTVSVRQPSIPTEYDQKGQYPGNVYMTLHPESQQTVLRGDYEKETTDHSPHEYVQLEKEGHCVAETTAEYTDLLGVGSGTSYYQTLTQTVDPVNDIIKLNESPVIADAEDRTSVSHDYWHLISSVERSNGNLADTGIAEVPTVANIQALGNAMHTECNQEISPDMTKDIRNGQCPGNVYMTLDPEADQPALKGDYEQATIDHMSHDYVQLEK